MGITEFKICGKEYSEMIFIERLLWFIIYPLIAVIVLVLVGMLIIPLLVIIWLIMLIKLFIPKK